MKRNSVPIIMVVLILAKILGFFKLRLIAQLFGATRELDMFWAAFTIPDMLINILILGSINAAVIPVFSKVLNKNGEEYLARLFYKINIIFFAFISSLSLIAFFFSRQIAGVLVGQNLDLGILQAAEDITQGDINLLVWLMRIMLISPIFLGLSSLLSAYLQVYRKFFITALAPLFYNVVIIFASLILINNAKMGVEGIAWAVVLGSVFHFVSQIPIFVKLSKEQKIWKKFKKTKEDFKEIYYITKLAIPRIIAVVGEQINVFVNIFISLTLSGGALSAYKFAFSLHLFPVQIVGGAISLVALPNLSEAYNQGNMKVFREIYNKGLQRSLFLILPMIAIVLVLRLPIVRLAYGVGEFDWWSTIITSWCLFLLSFSVLGQIIASLSLRAFYAIHDTKWPLTIIFIAIIINVLGSYYFTNFFSHYTDWRPIVGSILNNADWYSVKLLFQEMFVWFTTRNSYDAAVGGLAMSFSVAFLFEAFAYILVLHRKLNILTWGESVKPLIKKMISTFFMLLGMYSVFRLTDFNLDTTRTLNVFLIFVFTSLIGILIYLFFCKIFKVQELSLLDKYLHTAYSYAHPKKMLTSIPLVMSDYSGYFRIKIDNIFKKDLNGKRKKDD